MPKLHTIHFDLLCVAANWNAICLCCQTAYMLWMPCALKCENVIFSHFHLLLSFSVHFHLCARIELKICRAAAVLYCLSANAVAFNNQLSCSRSLLVCRSNLFFFNWCKKKCKSTTNFRNQNVYVVKHIPDAPHRCNKRRLFH